MLYERRVIISDPSVPSRVLAVDVPQLFKCHVPVVPVRSHTLSYQGVRLRRETRLPPHVSFLLGEDIPRCLLEASEAHLLCGRLPRHIGSRPVCSSSSIAALLREALDPCHQWVQVLDPSEIFVHLRDLIVVHLGNGQSLDGPLSGQARMNQTRVSEPRQVVGIDCPWVAR